ncbi:hypothetical protein OAS39_00595 [Pirellulales bacterium]|nr:hypothetical protein [Pirellulales bacterium]
MVRPKSSVKTRLTFQTLEPRQLLAADLAAEAAITADLFGADDATAARAVQTAAVKATANDKLSDVAANSPAELGDDFFDALTEAANAGADYNDAMVDVIAEGLDLPDEVKESGVDPRKLNEMVTELMSHGDEGEIYQNPDTYKLIGEMGAEKGVDRVLAGSLGDRFGVPADVWQKMSPGDVKSGIEQAMLMGYEDYGNADYWGDYMGLLGGRMSPSEMLKKYGGGSGGNGSGGGNGSSTPGNNPSTHPEPDDGGDVRGGQFDGGSNSGTGGSSPGQPGSGSGSTSPSDGNGDSGSAGGAGDGSGTGGQDGSGAGNGTGETGGTDGAGAGGGQGGSAGAPASPGSSNSDNQGPSGGGGDDSGSGSPYGVVTHDSDGGFTLAVYDGQGNQLGSEHFTPDGNGGYQGEHGDHNDSKPAEGTYVEGDDGQFVKQEEQDADTEADSGTDADNEDDPEDVNEYTPGPEGDLTPEEGRQIAERLGFADLLDQYFATMMDGVTFDSTNGSNDSTPDPMANDAAIAEIDDDFRNTVVDPDPEQQGGGTPPAPTAEQLAQMIMDAKGGAIDPIEA